MDNETLKKAQQVQLEIAKEIRRVCDENNINYFLDSGTLIGAVRHDGFIPWDDDLDLGMLREDYEKFVKIAPEKLKDNFFLQTWHTDKHCPYAFAKVRKKGTKYLEKYATETGMMDGVFVDVFPYDKLTSKKSAAFITKLIYRFCIYTLFIQSGMKPWLRHSSKLKSILVRVRYIPFKICSMIIKRDKLIAMSYKNSTKYNNTDAKMVYEQASVKCIDILCPIECYTDLIDHKFEDDMFKIPKNYDLVLKTMYGDYMKLPPEDQRENRHCVAEIKL